MDGDDDCGRSPRERDELTLGLVGLLLAAVVLETAYVAAFSPFSTTDASAHIGTAAAFVDSLAGFELGDRFLERNVSPAPNLVGNLLLALALPVLGVEWAERAVLVAYAIALPFATLYAVRAMSPGNPWLACFAIPLTFTLCLLWGFLSFSYSVVLFLVVAGFVLRSPPRMSRGRAAGLAALLVGTFFAHFVAYAVACLFVLLVLVLRARARADLRASILGRALVAIAPSAILAVVYLATSGSAGGATWSYSFARKLAGTLSLTWPMVTYDRLEILFCVAVVAALAVLAVLAAMRTRPWRESEPDTRAVGIFTVAVAVLAVVAPDDVGSGGSFISHRLALFPAFGALIWLAGQQLPRRAVVAAACVALAAAGGLAAVRYDELGQVERMAQDLAAVKRCVGDEATIVQGNLARVPVGSAGRIDVLTNEAGRIAADTDGLDLLSVDLRAPQWLQRYRSETSAAEHLVLPDAYVPDVPPPLDFAAFEDETGETVDYVLLFGRPAVERSARSAQSWRRFDRSLRTHYRLEARSPAGWWELWSPPGPAGAGDCV